MRPDRAGQRALAAFYGIPNSAIRDEHAGRNVVPANSVIEVLLERHKIGKPRREHVIMEHWKELVGPMAAHRCKPHIIDSSGTLHIIVANPILRRELLFKKRQILTHLRRLHGCAEIQDLDFQAG